MKILPNDLGEWCMCLGLMLMIPYGIEKIEKRLTIPEPPTSMFIGRPMPDGGVPFGAIIGAEGGTTVIMQNPEGYQWCTGIGTVPCAMPGGFTCTATMGTN